MSQRLAGFGALIGILVLRSIAAAGSDTITCTNDARTIEFTADENIRITYQRPGSGRKEELKGSLHDRSRFDASSLEFVLRPAGKPQPVKSHCAMAVIRSRSGKVRCTGREVSEVTFRQRVVITGARGQSLFAPPYFPADAIVAGRDSDALQLEVTCVRETVTTTGGCSAKPGEQSTMRRMECAEEDGLSASP